MCAPDRRESRETRGKKRRSFVFMKRLQTSSTTKTTTTTTMMIITKTKNEKPRPQNQTTNIYQQAQTVTIKELREMLLVWLVIDMYGIPKTHT